MDFSKCDDWEEILVNAISRHPSLHSLKRHYTATDERIWDTIAKSLGIQKSWLKKRWNSIHNEHEKITVYNRTHADKVQQHRLAEQLEFVPIDNRRAHEMDFSDLRHNQVVRIDKDVLDDFEMYPDTTIETIIPDEELIRHSEIEESEASTMQTYRICNAPRVFQRFTDKDGEIVAQPEAPRQLGSSRKAAKTIEKEATTPNERDEDSIFGELVVAMLKKMTTDEKKRAKKEIMNLLLQ